MLLSLYLCTLSAPAPLHPRALSVDEKYWKLKRVSHYYLNIIDYLSHGKIQFSLSRKLFRTLYINRVVM